VCRSPVSAQVLELGMAWSNPGRHLEPAITTRRAFVTCSTAIAAGQVDPLGITPIH
jgi:hypothetical protein